MERASGSSWPSAATDTAARRAASVASSSALRGATPPLVPARAPAPNTALPNLGAAGACADSGAPQVPHRTCTIAAMP